VSTLEARLLAAMMQDAHLGGVRAIAFAWWWSAHRYFTDRTEH
jgi:hypothetical protein